MAKKKASDWIPPVSFYFRVDFQRGKEHIKASFMEVSGLEMRMDVTDWWGDSYTHIKLPKSLSHGDITFKRPVMPLSEPFTVWMNDCFNSMKTMEKKIRTFDMVIKLLNSQGKPLAGWLGRHAYPVKWSLINLDAAKSELSNETITMTCASLKRITNIR